MEAGLDRRMTSVRFGPAARMELRIRERQNRMRRYLLVALLPAGLAAIALTTAVAARRTAASPAGAAEEPPDRAAPRAADDAEPDGKDDAPLSGLADIEEPGIPRSASRSAGVGETARRHSDQAAAREWVPGLIRLGLIGGAGGVASYGVMALLGRPIVKHGLAIDEPIFRWTSSHQVAWWAAVMERLNKGGNTWTTWGAVCSGAVCLGVSWRRQRWLPPAALGTALLVDYCSTHALHRTINRLGPPGNPLGTYPAGGVDRVILFYGLIAHMLWREFSGTQRGKMLTIGAVAALAYNQAYCREYLSQHWFIDIVSGLLYGVMLLVPFIVAIELIAAPARVEAGRPGPAIPVAS